MIHRSVVVMTTSRDMRCYILAEGKATVFHKEKSFSSESKKEKDLHEVSIEKLILRNLQVHAAETL